MSAPLEDYELSGLLDGELTAERAAVVRAIIANDSEVRERFRLLSSDHHAWRDAAKSSRFVPRLNGTLLTPSPGRASLLTLGPLVVALGIGRWALHVSTCDLITNLLMQSALLVLTIAIILRISSSCMETMSRPRPSPQ